MTFKPTLEISSYIVSILTFLGGVGAWLHYQHGFSSKKNTLEKYLKEAGESDKKQGKQGAYTSLHLTTKLGLTESEIIQASYRNPRIKRREKLAEDSLTQRILFQYNNDNPS